MVTDPFEPPEDANIPGPVGRPASAWRRMAARLLDAIGAGGVGMAAVALVAPMRTVEVHSLLTLAAPASLLAALWLGVSAAMLVVRGQSPGQWLVGVRVVAESGGAASPGAVFAREALLWLAVGFGPAGWLALAGELLFLASGRTVRDRLTGCQVVVDAGEPVAR